MIDRKIIIQKCGGGFFRAHYAGNGTRAALGRNPSEARSRLQSIKSVAPMNTIKEEDQDHERD